tara:strand:+ start:85 stop:333 length:249 start_codon:yes stop_codon:yes gene_type:complete
MTDKAIKGTFDKEAVDAFNRCVGAGITIYPVPLSNGSSKTKAKVKIVVDYGLKKQESKEKYSQGLDLTSKIIELYKIISKKV